MPRARGIVFRGQAEGHAAAAALLERPGDAALDYRAVPRTLVMSCPDGCGDILSINLDARAGKAWRADRRSGQLTLYPSVWRERGCRAHFIVWRDRLIWCDYRDTFSWRDDSLTERVAAALPPPTAQFRHYEDMADLLDAIPWEVLWACQTLERRGLAESCDKSHFRRCSSGVRATVDRLA